jgi:hypothetical protein
MPIPGRRTRQSDSSVSSRFVDVELVGQAIRIEHRGLVVELGLERGGRRRLRACSVPHRRIAQRLHVADAAADLR